MRLSVRLVLAAFAAAVCSASAGADDITAAARGVVRVIAGAKDEEQTSVSFGSGFAISPHRVVTNAHVVEDAENPFADSVVAVVPSEGNRALRGTIVAYDAIRDLAVVDVGEARLEPLAIYSGPVDSGERAAALGYPGNVDLATARSIYDLIAPSSPVRSEGNISSERSVDGKSALLHTAAISRGNSGGPLVDGCGRVLGVNTYTTRSDSGDAPFGFAVVSQELMSFLREHGEQFQQIGTGCVTLAEQAQREQQARDSAARTEAIAKQRTDGEQASRIEAAKAELQESRENHAAGSALLAVLSVLAGAFAAVLFLKDRAKLAAASAAVALVGLAGGAYAFFSRPSLNVETPRLTTAAAAATADTSLAGKLLCQVRPELSRVTVSSTDDLAMTWDASGCMNGRTQYVKDGSRWRRVLVPNGSETVALQAFDPAKGEYISTRYLLPQNDMERLRGMRASETGSSCTSNGVAIQQLQQLTEQLVSSLPSTPNEKLVYSCRGS